MHLQGFGFPMSTERQLASQEEILLEELPAKTIIIYKSRPYTCRDVVDWFANKAGGAHYSKRVPRAFAELLSLRLFEYPFLVNALIQLAELVLDSGRNLLKRLSDGETHLLCAVPDQTIPKQAYLFDTRHPRLPVRTSLLLTPTHGLRLRVTSLRGTRANVESARLLNWTGGVHHIILSSTINTDLSTTLQITFDGDVVAARTVPVPHLVASNATESETYWNRAADGPPQQLTFGVAAYLEAGPAYSLADVVKRFRFVEEERLRPDLTCVVYCPESFGHRAANSGTVVMQGQVLDLPISQYVSGEAGGGAEVAAAPQPPVATGSTKSAT